MTPEELARLIEQAEQRRHRGTDPDELRRHFDRLAAAYAAGARTSDQVRAEAGMAEARPPYRVETTTWCSPTETALGTQWTPACSEHGPAPMCTYDRDAAINTARWHLELDHYRQARWGNAASQWSSGMWGDGL